ncbi:MAG: hypothetical protein WC446_01525 [Candidatus Paceibacterota bacterium]|jgi:hypothetical protein
MKFYYEEYSYKEIGRDIKISFLFKINDVVFKPKVIIKNASLDKKNKKVLNNLVFNLGMIEMFSYWKAFCAPQIIVRAGKLNKRQVNWWEKLLINGMGQFFYENKIKKQSIKIISEGEDTFKKGKVTGKEIMIPVGGGKDSAVTLNIFKEKNPTCFVLNPDKTNLKMVGKKELIVAKREIEKNLLEMNKKGFYNGHTPFVAYLSFLSVLISYLFNKKYIVFSNEDSANEENVIWLQKKINHQYSKTYEFEKDFRIYCSDYLMENVEYFSALRMLYEIQIGLIFSHMKDYHNIFLSCNEASKTNSGTKKKTGKWCNNCSKCLFVYLILYPFLNEEELLSIFGEDLFENKKLLPILKELTGEKKIKPFECVGTRAEVLVALYLGSKKERKPYMIRYFEKNILPKHKDWEKMASKVMNHWNTKNFIPEEFKL